MREIKFRFWATESKKWITPHIWTGTNGNFWCGNEHEGEIVVHQYTGMKDSKGKEIYEGDILQCEYDDRVDPMTGEKGNMKVIMKVNWDGFGFNLEEVFTGMRFYEDKWEVIGNVFENEKLLHPEGIAVA